QPARVGRQTVDVAHRQPGVLDGGDGGVEGELEPGAEESAPDVGLTDARDHGPAEELGLVARAHAVTAGTRAGYPGGPATWERPTKTEPSWASPPWPPVHTNNVLRSAPPKHRLVAGSGVGMRVTTEPSASSTTTHRALVHATHTSPSAVTAIPS